MDKLYIKIAKWAGVKPFQVYPNKIDYRDCTKSLDFCFKDILPEVIQVLMDIDVCTQTEAYHKLFDLWLKESKEEPLTALKLSKIIEQIIDDFDEIKRGN